MRSYSSAYFLAALSALTIPPWSHRTVQLIEREYDKLIVLEQYGEQTERKGKQCHYRLLEMI